MIAERGGVALTRAVYLVGLMLLLTPALNLVVAWPPRLGEAAWRFQQFNTLVNGLAPATLGLAIILYAARALGQPRLQAVLGALAVLGAVCVMGLTANYLLDVLELRALINPDERGGLLRLALKSSIQSAVVVAVLVALGFTGLRRRRGQVASARGRAEPMLRTRQVEKVADG